MLSIFEMAEKLLWKEERMRIKIRKRAQITIPGEIMQTLLLKEGDELELTIKNRVICLALVKEGEIKQRKRIPYPGKQSGVKAGTTPVPLVFLCFGGFSVYYHGVTMGIASKKAKELLALLLLQNGRPLSKKVIAELLWPDKIPQKSMACFYKTNQYLKNVPEFKEIFPLINSGGALSLDMSQVYSDINEFSQLLRQAPTIENRRRMLLLYQGSLFQNETFEWLSSQEAYFDMEYLEAAEWLIREYKSHNLVQEAQKYIRLIFED